MPAMMTQDEVKPRMPMTSTYLMSMLAAACLLCTSALAQAPAATPGTPAATAGGDPAKGREKTQMCEGCHEIPGWRTAFPEVYHVPKIAGQHEAYIVAALKAYRSGERSHPSMRGIATPLSDQDIANLAAYYARGLTQTASK
ncbi:MAG TPA: cytochrome c [Casimicrobiaceae bacterium]|nr:cytochrome c [Casimicrobiaceae bacterium]